MPLAVSSLLALICLMRLHQGSTNGWVFARLVFSQICLSYSFRV